MVVTCWKQLLRLATYFIAMIGELLTGVMDGLEEKLEGFAVKKRKGP